MLTSTTIRTTCQLENCSHTFPFSSTLIVSNQNIIFQSNFKSAPSFFFFLVPFSVRLCLHSILRSPTSWLIFFFFLIDFMVQSSFRFIGKTEQKTLRFPMLSRSHTGTASPLATSAGTIFMTGEHALTHRNHPKSVVCIRVYSGIWTNV